MQFVSRIFLIISVIVYERGNPELNIEYEIASAGTLAEKHAISGTTLGPA